jgi:hypothetical protein
MKKRMKKTYMGGGMVSPRKEMAMGYQMGGSVAGDVRRAVDMAATIGDAMAEAVAKPRGNVTGMQANNMDRMMGVSRRPMSSGGMRPPMRKGTLV